ncbi:MAG: hypothetical protein IPL26_29405 [Leptospiraceae bacterium]|nr:hypothetical protein [Leptospiraceae bacterium]
MNKLFKLSLFLTISLTFTLFAQETPKANTQPPAKDGAKSEAKKEDTMAMLKDYTPIAQLDPSLAVTGITYLKRAAHNGKGDVLDVQVNLENTDHSTRDYSIYVFAYHETKIPVVNKLAPPPVWRENDPHKLDTTVDFSVLSPEKITPEIVWGADGLKARQEKSEKEKLKGYHYVVGEPSLNEYMLYLTKKPEKALKIKLYSEAVPKDKVTETNFKNDEAELKVDMNNKAVDSHTYTVFNSKYKTTVTTHHYSEFRNNFFFFNRVAVLIFNDKNALVYRNITDIGKKREHK